MRYQFKIGQKVAVNRGDRTTAATIASRSRLKTVEGFTLPDGGPFYTLDDGETVRQAQISPLERLPVIFRADKEGEVTAVFPTECGDYHGRYFTVYAHVGQHSSGSLDWYRTTRPATDDESADLLRELKRIYETGEDPVALQVCKRMTSGHRDAFRRSARRIAA